MYKEVSKCLIKCLLEISSTTSLEYVKEISAFFKKIFPISSSRLIALDFVEQWVQYPKVILFKN